VIARIVPAVRLPASAAEQFEYSVPDHLAPAIMPGTVVIIPFAGRRVPGLVISVKESSESGKTLKAIIGIAQGLNRLPAYTIDLWQKLIGIFATTWPRWCWMALPNVPERSIERGLLTPRDERQEGKPINGSSLSSIFVNEPDDQLIAVQKTIESAAGRQVLILVPTVREASAWADEISGSRCYHSLLSAGSRYSIACACADGTAKTIIGTKSAVLLPFLNLYSIVIVSAGSSSHKQEDSDPRFDARIVAEETCLAAGARLSCLDPWPPLGRWKTLNASRLITPVVHDLLNAARREKSRVLLDDSVQEALDKTVKSGGRALVLLNRRGVSASLICRDCGMPICCLDCGLPLTNQFDRLTCAADGRAYPLPERCVKCEGTDFKPVGSGSKTIFDFLKKLFPNVSIAHFGGEVARADPDKNQIIVGTTAIFRSFAPRFKPFDIAVDVFLAGGPAMKDYNSVEETARIERSLVATLKSGGELHIQTHDPSSPALLALRDPKSAINHELAERQAFGFPPFNIFITIYGSGTDESRLWGEAIRVFESVKSHMPRAICHEPTWSRPKLFRKKYRLSFTVKTEPRTDYSGMIRLLPPGFAIEARMI